MFGAIAVVLGSLVVGLQFIFYSVLLAIVLFGIFFFIDVYTSTD